MNIFETELKKMTAECEILKNPKLVGSICIARLTDILTVEIGFANSNVRGKSYGIRITVLNRHQGEVDSLEVSFTDICGGKETWFVWSSDESKWYNYCPTTADYANMAKAISDYLENFAD